MQLDKTHIQIRNRNENELLDIALHVICRFPVQIFLSFALLAIPLLLLNNLLIGHILTLDYNLAFQMRTSIVEETYTSSDISYKTFLVLQVILIISEAPIASILSTVMLSKLIFNETPTLSSIIKIGLKNTGKIFASLGLKRGVLFIVLLAALMRTPDSITRGFILATILIAFFVFIWVRGARPFILEIILLEQSDAESSNKMSLQQRSRMLHTTVGGNVFGRSMYGLVVGCCLAICMHGCLTFLSVNLFTETGTMEHLDLTARWIFPIACWLAVLYTSVVRFLNYLDTRILLEGWEAELKIRSEAMRIKQRQPLGTNW
jgi:hypothetical protein